ncbi:hypothetical protein C8Q73DRAFT_289189 [Cubamyces lactineus]|nr:hypothetical protein C8Q73DRAFT_289189 [Cubamyces lactineus]
MSAWVSRPRVESSALMCEWSCSVSVFPMVGGDYRAAPLPWPKGLGSALGTDACQRCSISGLRSSDQDSLLGTPPLVKKVQKSVGGPQ